MLRNNYYCCFLTFSDCNGYFVFYCYATQEKVSNIYSNGSEGFNKTPD